MGSWAVQRASYGKGWYNTGGGDMKFLEAMLDHFNQNACIDQGRIFSTGSASVA
jgi:poly(3-hydroxybutyrate) depolymerase